MRTAGEDYDPVRQLVTFHIGDTYESKQCFYVYINFDQVSDVEEFFYIIAYAEDIQVYLPDGYDHTAIIIHDSESMWSSLILIHHSSKMAW